MAVPIGEFGQYDAAPVSVIVIFSQYDAPVSVTVKFSQYEKPPFGTDGLRSNKGYAPIFRSSRRQWHVLAPEFPQLSISGRPSV